MKEWPICKGKKTMVLEIHRSEGHRDYTLLFFKGDALVAELYYNMGVQEICLRVPDNIVLRKETLDSFEPFFDVQAFRFNRKRIQRKYKRGKK